MSSLVPDTGYQLINNSEFRKFKVTHFVDDDKNKITNIFQQKNFIYS